MIVLAPQFPRPGIVARKDALSSIHFADIAKRDAAAAPPDWTAAVRSSKWDFQTPAKADGAVHS